MLQYVKISAKMYIQGSLYTFMRIFVVEKYLVVLYSIIKQLFRSVL